MRGYVSAARIFWDYFAAFDRLVLGYPANECKFMSMAKYYEMLPKRISDGDLSQFAVIDTHDRIGGR